MRPNRRPFNIADVAACCSLSTNVRPLHMSPDIPEPDWRIFRSLHSIWLDRFCQRVNSELIAVLSNKSRSQHERYLAAYKLIHKRDRQIGDAFNDFRRSTA